MTVSRNVDPKIRIKKLTKSGKHAEVWGASKITTNNVKQNRSKKEKEEELEHISFRPPSPLHVYTTHNLLTNTPMIYDLHMYSFHLKHTAAHIFFFVLLLTN